MNAEWHGFSKGLFSFAVNRSEIYFGTYQHMLYPFILAAKRNPIKPDTVLSHKYTYTHITLTQQQTINWQKRKIQTNLYMCSMHDVCVSLSLCESKIIRLFGAHCFDVVIITSVFCFPLLWVNNDDIITFKVNSWICFPFIILWTMKMWLLLFTRSLYSMLLVCYSF